MRPTVGCSIFRTDWFDDVWNQCDGPRGEHGGLRLVPWDWKADHVLCIGPPISGRGRPGLSALGRRWSKLTGRYEQRRTEVAFASVGRDPSDVTSFIFEPPAFVPDCWYQIAGRFASRVFGPDRRAKAPTVLPSVWTVDGDLKQWRDAPPPAKTTGLTCVTSGASGLPGHRARLRFIRLLREAGVELDLFGRGLAPTLGGLGPVRSKTTALLPATLALVIENDSTGDWYVTEKLWDALICWCLPLYFGSAAAERVLPAEAIVRLPDLDARGVEVVKAALADPGLWSRRRDAIAEARRRTLGDLRLVEWVRREIGPTLGL